MSVMLQKLNSPILFVAHNYRSKDAKQFQDIKVIKKTQTE